MPLPFSHTSPLAGVTADQRCRKLGRLVEARAIEDELRDLLVYADPDLWLLRQLQALEEAVASSSSRWPPCGSEATKLPTGTETRRQRASKVRPPVRPSYDGAEGDHL
ncbi:MAG: hypothetical protein IH849_14635 [Acidobacteria bacterium]|nr:hypothetical protein [Acidobacteriota bacterium]